MASSTSANSTNTASKGSEGENSDSNPVFGIATLGFLGGTGYWDTRKPKVAIPKTGLESEFSPSEPFEAVLVELAEVELAII